MPGTALNKTPDFPKHSNPLLNNSWVGERVGGCEVIWGGLCTGNSRLTGLEHCRVTTTSTTLIVDDPVSCVLPAKRTLWDSLLRRDLASQLFLLGREPY